MDNTILNQFETAVDTLINANPRNSSKGKGIKQWAEDNFHLSCSVSHVTDPRAIGNRVSEQMRYNSPIVVFVCDQSINVDTLKGYIIDNTYKELSDVLIMSDKRPYSYTLLMHFKDSDFCDWISDTVGVSIEECSNIINENNSRQIDQNNKDGKGLYYLIALRTKPFVLLAGISGTGKSRIVRKLAQASVTEDLQRRYDPKSVAKGFNRWELHKPANFELIQVKPNWHNSLEVVGYKSNIGGAHYEYTPFVEFVARAWKEPEVPFFLCLDEMNLAPVEQYFAEFLSAIESRSIENGFYETDPIIKPFESFDTKDDEGNVVDKLSDRMIAHLVGKLDTQRKSEIADRLRTKGLTLPQNLLVMGTVNMDETTFSFSRKVLDRAMSVVMNEVDYEGFFDGNTENDVAEMNEATRNLLIDRPIRGLEAENNEANTVKEYLTNINKVLEDTPFKLGYRAANEALLYVSAAYKFNSDADIHVALDDFTMMKILSRIEGDKRSIGNLLDDLKAVITSDYPKSNEKLVKMAETLKNKQFVSYWT